MESGTAPATVREREQNGMQFYLIRALPKSWRNYAIVAITLSFGLYFLGALWSYADGSLSAFLSSSESAYEPFYLLTHMVVLKLVYGILQRKLAGIQGVFSTSEARLRADSAVIFSTPAAILLALPFIAYDTMLTLQLGVSQFFSPYLLLIVSYDVDWLFWGGIAWFMVGFLLFVAKLSRYPVKGSSIEIVVGDKLAGIKDIAASLAVPVILYQFTNTYYYFLVGGFWASEWITFFTLLALIALLFAVPRAVISSMVSDHKDKIVAELTANYVAYLQRVLKGEEEYDANKANHHHELRNMLDKRLGEQRDLAKALLPILLPLVNLALAYIVETTLKGIIKI